MTADRGTVRAVVVSGSMAIGGFGGSVQGALRDLAKVIAALPGGLVFEAEVARSSLVPEAAHLSAREWQMVEGALSDWTNREIAEEFDCKEQTVKNHLHTVYKKLGLSVRSRNALRAWAAARGMAVTVKHPGAEPATLSSAPDTP